MRDQVMADLEAISLEQRNDVWRTVWAALNLPPDQRKPILGMEDDRRRKAWAEVGQFLQIHGIQFGNDQRRRFAHRYFTERRTIEETLKKEDEARRTALTEEFNAKLKKEFGPDAQVVVPTQTDDPKNDQPKREPERRQDSPNRGSRGDRPEGDNKGPGDGDGPDGKGRSGRGERGPGRGPGGPGGPDGRGPGGPGGFGNFDSRVPLGPPAPPSAQDLQAMRDRAMRQIERLTQEQRAEVWRTVAAVLKLSEEKRKAVVTMEEERRKKPREEMERTLQTIGIQLTNEQRGRFFRRYFSERHAMEEKLKKDDAARRAELMQELGAKLKVEFAAQVGSPVPEPERK